MHKMKFYSITLILITTFFVVRIISSTIIHWRKNDFIRPPLICESNKILFLVTVHDPFECRTICFRHHSCIVSSFKPDSHECIGCKEFRIWYFKMDHAINYAIRPYKRAVSDCKEILDEYPEAESGFYEIELWQSRKILIVNCDMDTDGGGWTIFHRRFDGSVKFYRNFTEYENGFGNTGGELWLGLKYIQELADQSHSEVRVDIENYNNDTAYETFQEFKLIDGRNYKLNIGLRDLSTDKLGGLAHNNLLPFTTYDRDLDTAWSRNCAVDRHGGWWYGSCTSINLNGLYVSPDSPDTPCKLVGAESFNCVHLHSAFGHNYKLRSSSMMLRRT